jgi:hypothetical protein
MDRQQEFELEAIGICVRARYGADDFQNPRIEDSELDDDYWYGTLVFDHHQTTYSMPVHTGEDGSVQLYAGEGDIGSKPQDLWMMIYFEDRLWIEGVVDCLEQIAAQLETSGRKR